MEEVRSPPKTNISTSREPYSFLKNTTNMAHIGSSNNINESNRVTTYPSSGYTPGNFQSATPVQQSNPNLSSQRTVSNAGTTRRVEIKDIKVESPRQMEGSSNIQRYAISKDLNEVNNMVRKVERNVSYIPARPTASGNGSIYLN